LIKRIGAKIEGGGLLHSRLEQCFAVARDGDELPAAVIELGPAAAIELGPAAVIELGPAAVIELGPAAVIELGPAAGAPAAQPGWRRGETDRGFRWLT
jgi:hypothetical protein